MAERRRSNTRHPHRSQPHKEPSVSLTRAERVAPVPGPLIEITPSPAEYKELCCDLAKLRKLGAPSNTAAVLAAIHAAAEGTMPHRSENAGRRQQRPRHGKQEVES